MKALTADDFKKAAKLLGCDVQAIQAVCSVEAPKGGFNPDGTPVTLFEGHKFHRYTQGQYDKEYPHLSYPKWVKKWYGKTWQVEQARLQEAMELDREAALMSASWGRFQIMGFNFAICGFANIQSFINAMYRSEGDQLAAFCAYVKHTGLDDELRKHDWKGFARGYNGADFWQNLYDQRLAQAYAKFCGD